MGLFMAALPIIPSQYSPDGKVLIQARPMQAERRYLDLRKQAVRLPSKRGLPWTGKLKSKPLAIET
jgi:hypothetical protein